MKKVTFTTIFADPYRGYYKTLVKGYIFRKKDFHVKVYKGTCGIWYATICGASIGTGNTRRAAIIDALNRRELVTSERIKKARDIYRKAARV